VSRPVDWHALDYASDPVPGDPSVVRHYASQYSDVAAAIGRASSRLRAIADEQNAEAEFIYAFRDQAVEVADKISKAKERYAGVAAAVSGYAAPLENAQTAADAALGRARVAKDDFDAANKKVNHYNDEINFNSQLTDDEKHHYTQLLHLAKQDYTDGINALYQAKLDLQSAIDSRDAAARYAVDQIKDVENTGGLNDSGWDNWVQFWEEHGELIDNIVNILGWVAAIATVILMCIPGVNAIVFTIIAVVMAVIVISNAVAQMSAGTKSVGMGILEIALALIPFGAGKLLKPGIKLATAAAKETAVTSIIKSSAGQGIEHMTKDAALELVEAEMKAARPTVAQSLMYEQAREMAELQAVRNMDILVSGAAPRVMQVVDQNLWRLTVVPSAFAEKIFDGVVTAIAEPLIDGPEGGSE
jgi:hypothetical protein